MSAVRMKAAHSRGKIYTESSYRPPGIHEVVEEDLDFAALQRVRRLGSYAACEFEALVEVGFATVLFDISFLMIWA